MPMLRFTSAMSFFTRRDARFAFVYMAPTACFVAKQERSDHEREWMEQSKSKSKNDYETGQKSNSTRLKNAIWFE